MSVMHEQPELLTLSAGRPNVTLHTRALERAQAACGQLSVIIGFEAGGGTARQDTVGIWRPGKDLPLYTAKETCLRRITCRVPAKAVRASRRCKELTPKTTESHGSGGQREP